MKTAKLFLPLILAGLVAAGYLAIRSKNRKPEVPQHQEVFESEPQPTVHVTSGSDKLASASSQAQLPETAGKDREQKKSAQKSLDEKISVFKNQLPTKSDLQKLTPEEAHLTPKIVIQAAMNLAEVTVMLDEHPDLSEQGFKFYRECAEQGSSPNSMRATCYYNYEKLLRQHPTQASSLKDDAQISDHIKRLAGKLGTP